MGTSHIFTFFLTLKCQHQETRNIEIKCWLNCKKIQSFWSTSWPISFYTTQMKEICWISWKLLFELHFLNHLFLVVSIWWTVPVFLLFLLICCFENLAVNSNDVKKHGKFRTQRLNVISIVSSTSKYECRHQFFNIILFSFKNLFQNWTEEFHFRLNILLLKSQRNYFV